uniref:G-protein coupled receptors family 1 profile domain-containing protein n=1 Tax=Adineta vaga TaxID=104782 RepID=B3G4S3_ADIVA|nr:unknown [Adineta vaga]
MILVGNTCVATLAFAINILCMNTFTLYNDLKQIEYEYSLCVLLGYLSYTTCAIQNYSFLLHAIYRYLLIVHPTRLFWHSCLFPLLFLYTGQLIYDVDNQMCQMFLRFSFPVIYMAFCLYIIPVSMTMSIYLILVRYVKKMNTHMVTMNRLSRAQRDLKMVRRIIILIIILIGIFFPYQLFLILSFFNRAPRYNFRIGFLFGEIGMVYVIVALFKFTDPLKMTLMKIIINPTNMIIPAVS